MGSLLKYGGQSDIIKYISDISVICFGNIKKKCPGPGHLRFFFHLTFFYAVFAEQKSLRTCCLLYWTTLKMVHELIVLSNIKFGFSEKATKFEQIFVILLTRASCSLHKTAYLSKSWRRFFKTKVDMSCYTNFTIHQKFEQNIK